MEDYNDKLIKKYNINEDDFYNFNDTENMNYDFNRVKRKLYVC